MKILFIHQNFPGQFKFLAPALHQLGHQVVAMVMRSPSEETHYKGVRLCFYQPLRGSTPKIHPWIIDLESKTIRAEACFRAALDLKKQGFIPDVIIAHHGWGESLFLKQVWPNCKLGIYAEFFYELHGQDFNFDPEFPADDPAESCRLYMKNINNFLHFQLADGGISPTYWQASTFPEPFKSKIKVIHDGIDTNIVKPKDDVKIVLNKSIEISNENEIITFINRNLEPYRGYHIFMRSLPSLLKRRPHARILIVGGDQVSYGSKSQSGQSWKEIFIQEVRPKLSDLEWQRIHFLGSVSYQTFLSILQISSIHVYLTYPFVLSWSLLEAMSAGCAIIASDTQPVREAIIDHETGLLVDFFNHNEFSEKINLLLEDHKLRSKLSINARKFAINNYDLKTICLPEQLNWLLNLVNQS